MAGTFGFLGEEAVGAAVSRGLEARGWRRVENVEAADAVFTYFTHAGALEDAYFDSEGLVKIAREGTVLVDLSPSTPSLARELAAVSAVNDLQFVEAPLVVTDPSAADALAPDCVTCYVAADDIGLLGEAENLVSAFSENVVRTGSSGTAQVAKAACTSQICAQVLSAVESAALYDAVGVAAKDALLPACSDLSADMLSAIRAEAFSGSYTVEMMMGDVVAVLTAADDANLILPQVEATMHLLEVLAVIGGADMAPAALSLLYRDEQASADNGLDWTRAEGMFGESDDAHGHDHDEDGFGGYDDDAFGYAGGFGGYSAN